MQANDITIAARDGGAFSAYLATPAAGRGPGLVVIQEIFGVNGYMRTVCDRLAAAGFTALCPDLFWRQQPGIQITDRTDEEWQQAFKLYQGFDVDLGVEDIGATIDHLRGHEACSGKVGAVGFCLGGLLAYLTATRTDADCAVGYYGVGIHEKLDEAANIRKPLLLHIAEEDGFVDKAAQARMREGLGGHPLVTLHSYPGADHAFARDGGAHFDAEAAALARNRSLAFLRDALS